jgi:hypothetical protein
MDETPTGTSGDGTSPENAETEFSQWVGNNGGLYLYAEPGELVVDVAGIRLDDQVKNLQTILATPDRQVVDAATVTPADSREEGRGGSALATVSTKVEQEGVYVVNVTALEDQFGSDIAWSIRTNADRYVFDSAGRYGQDNPITLRDPNQSGSVWFQPIDREIAVDVVDVPSSVSEIPLRDSTDEVVTTLSVENGEASGTIPAADGTRENTPWGLEFSTARGKVHVDGVTRWPNDDDPYPELRLWTTGPEQWTSIEPNRWLLRPYRRRLYGAPGDSGSQSFTIVNNDSESREFDLSLEHTAGSWDVALSESSVEIPAYETDTVDLAYTLPESGNETRTTRLIISPQDGTGYTTYASLSGSTERETHEPISTPIRLQPYRHENAQLGYWADYPTTWEKYVDLNNRPSVRVPEGIETLRNGEWQVSNFAETVESDTAAFENASFDLDRSITKIAYDADNDMYIVAPVDGRAALLHSSDGGRTFTAYDLGTEGQFDIEQFSGHNVPERPPTLVRAIQTKSDEDSWRRVSDLELIPVEKQNGQLSIGEPILLSDMALGVGSHSGVPSAVVSKESIAHVVWGEATDPEKEVPGTPAYVVSYDRENQELLGSPELVGYGKPANDTHNRPSITLDSEGYLHVLTGTHGDTFHYARSQTPNSAHDGWTDAVPVGDGLEGTYIGLVCDSEDTLHLAYRLWRFEKEPFPNTHHAVLGYQRKPKGESWEAPRRLLVSAFPGYSIFYHRLTIDREDRLMLSYDYWSVFRFYRQDYPEQQGHHRKTMFSDDGGDSWDLLQTDDLRL